MFSMPPMYIAIAIAVFGAIALLITVEAIKRRRRKKRYPAQPDGVRRCTACGKTLRPGATDCSHCGADSVVIIV
ncbi:MAG: zinc ribbon domain-containing protein [Gemmatimonadaceae bacterium]